MSNAFSPGRLRVARARREMTLKELAEKAGISARMLSTYENGHSKSPPEETIKNFAEVLSYPVAFFYGEDIEEVKKEAVSFRSMSRMRARQRDSAIASGQIALVFNDWLERKFNLPSENLLNLYDKDPESAAYMVREHWHLGNQSIRNMIHLLEAQGVRVFSLFENNVEVDAFSFWSGKTPFIFLNLTKSGERGRFDAAHELGHLILHQNGVPHGPEAEREADRFASAFLMPEESVRSKAVPFPSLSHLISMKSLWLVSVAALTRRLKDLQLISEWHYRTLNIEMSKKGFLKSEPRGMARERSAMLEKILTRLWSEGISQDQIAKELNIAKDDLVNLVFSCSSETYPQHWDKNKPELSVIK